MSTVTGSGIAYDLAIYRNINPEIQQKYDRQFEKIEDKILDGKKQVVIAIVTVALIALVTCSILAICSVAWPIIIGAFMLAIVVGGLLVALPISATINFEKIYKEKEDLLLTIKKEWEERRKAV
jgi:uncharacterized membrane protein